LVDGDIARLSFGCAVASLPFGNQPSIFSVALCGAMIAQIVVFTIDGYDGEFTGFLESIGGGAGWFLACVRPPRLGQKQYGTVLATDLFASLPTTDRCLTLKLGFT